MGGRRLHKGWSGEESRPPLRTRGEGPQGRARFSEAEGGGWECSLTGGPASRSNEGGSRKLESGLGPQDRWRVFEAEDARLGLADFQAPRRPLLSLWAPAHGPNAVRACFFK